MKKIISILFALFVCGAAFAQSADVVTQMLEAEEVTFGQVCYLSAVQQGFLGDEATFDEAINVLFEEGQIPEVVDKNSSVALTNLAYIYAQMWDVKGGLMYRLTKGSPRYAFKQLKADGVIDENADPASIVSGVEALNIYTSCAIEYGDMTMDTEE